MMKKIAERVVSMQKTKKEKKRLTPNKTSEDALDLIFNEIKGLLMMMQLLIIINSF